jgi:acetate kinase
MHTMQTQSRSILIINAGSSTIKFSIFDIQQNNKGEDETLCKTYTGLVDKVTTTPFLRVKKCGQQQAPKSGQLQNTTIVEQSLTLSPRPYDHAMQEIIVWLQRHNINVVAAGHRVAHGGARYAQAMPVNDEVLAYLETLSPLAPLHQPYNLNGSRILQQQFPQILQVVAFDTSFHTTCNSLSQHFALPQRLIAKGVRRYGFHGLSYDYIVSQFDKYLPQNKVNGKIIIAHLGQGASMCAVANQKSVATTLSFSALDGLPMGTRCGNIDPGVLLHLMTEYNMNAKQIETLLYKESGLLGLSGGISSDMRELLASSDPHAKLAVDVFVYKTSAWIGMLAAELQGLDGLVFTAGIGENAAYVREQICARAAWLGVKIDAAKNAQHAATISTADSAISAHVIPTDEELTIARDTLHYLR